MTQQQAVEFLSNLQCDAMYEGKLIDYILPKLMNDNTANGQKSIRLESENATSSNDSLAAVTAMYDGYINNLLEQSELKIY